MEKNKVVSLINEVRRNVPLVHNITNYVTVNDCANAVLAIGASPIMADDINEAADITSISSALVINIGTLNVRTIESMIAAGKKANEIGIPVVFDPVGAGASNLRNSTTQRILEEVKADIIRGNLSEMSYIAGIDSSTKGVDSSEEDESNDAVWVARNVAERYQCVSAITGARDIVSDGKRTVSLSNGVQYLSKVTGTGCMTSAIMGAYAGAAAKCERYDYFHAACAAISSMSIAGEIAYEKVADKGTGSFHVAIIDQLSKMSEELMSERIIMRPVVDYSLYLCTDRELMSSKTIEESVESAIKGGVTVVQLREKDCSSKEFYDVAVSVKKITDKYNVPLIINDRIDIAMAVDAAGVHIGQSDLPADVVRKIIGKDKIIGVSAARLDEAVKAVEDGADYLGVGAMYATATKTDARPVVKEELMEIRRHVDVPIVIIGGINMDTLDNFKDTGVEGLAVISAIVAKEDVEAAARQIYEAWKNETGTSKQ